MNPTCTIRRIDDLGRIVIPKEIRRSLRIHESDPLELYVEDGSIVIKKYSTISSVYDLAKDLCTAYFRECGCIALVSDRDVIVAGPSSFPGYDGKAVSPKVTEIMSSRHAWESTGETIDYYADAADSKKMDIVVPIITCDEVDGAVIVLADACNEKGVSIEEKSRIAGLVARFLQKQLEV